MKQKQHNNDIKLNNIIIFCLKTRQNMICEINISYKFILFKGGVWDFQKI